MSRHFRSTSHSSRVWMMDISLRGKKQFLKSSPMGEEFYFPQMFLSSSYFWMLWFFPFASLKTNRFPSRSNCRILDEKNWLFNDGACSPEQSTTHLQFDQKYHMMRWLSLSATNSALLASIVTPKGKLRLTTILPLPPRIVVPFTLWSLNRWIRLSTYQQHRDRNCPQRTALLANRAPLIPIHNLWKSLFRWKVSAQPRRSAFDAPRMLNNTNCQRREVMLWSLSLIRWFLDGSTSMFHAVSEANALRRTTEDLDHHLWEISNWDTINRIKSSPFDNEHLSSQIFIWSLRKTKTSSIPSSQMTRIISAFGQWKNVRFSS